VMPGHVGTDIFANTYRILGGDPLRINDAELEAIRADLIRVGWAAEDASTDELRQSLVRWNAKFRDSAPLNPAEAATVILDGILAGVWRILVGEDAKRLDALVRSKPEDAYDWAELYRRATEAAKTTPGH